MNINKQEKFNVIKEISLKINSSKSVVVANYTGMTVADFQELRKRLSEKDVELKVYKNRLFKIAAKEAGIGEINDSLIGSNAFAFGMSDDISPAKILDQFSKDKEILKLVSGTFEGKVLDSNGIAEIALLPTFEEALSMLARQMLSPIKFIGKGLFQLTQEDHLDSNSTQKIKKEVSVKSEIKEGEQNG